MRQDLWKRKAFFTAAFAISAMGLLAFFSVKNREKSLLRGPAYTAQISSKPNIVMLMMDDLDFRLFQDFLVDSPRVITSPAIRNARKAFFESRLGQVPASKNAVFQGKEYYDISWMNWVKSQGVEFTRFYTTDSLCCPSRATLLTGQCAKNHGVLNVMKTSKVSGLKYWMNDDGTPRAGAEDSALPVWLSSAGYYVGHIGKYLNGYGSKTYGSQKGYDYVPAGYHFWRGLTGVSTYSMYDFWVSEQGLVHRNFNQKEYQTEVLTQYTQDFVDQAEKSGKPFSLFLMTPAPHIEENYTSEFESLSKKYSEAIRPSAIYDLLRDEVESDSNPELHPSLTTSGIVDLAESDRSDKPDAIAGNSAPNQNDRTALVKQYKSRLASLFSIDDLLGVLIATLEAKGMRENTIIVLTSDNGYMYGEHTQNGKMWAYEESIHLPLIIAAPNSPASVQVDALTANTDLAPTMADWAGAIPTNTINPNFQMDGRSMNSLLVNIGNSANWPRKLLFIDNFLTSGNVSSKPETFAAVRYKDTEHDFLYTHYYANPEVQSGVSTFTELYDHSANLGIPGAYADVLQQSNLSERMRDSALGLKVGLDRLIQEYLKPESVGESIQTLEDKSFEIFTENRANQFTGCLIEYTLCPAYGDFHPQTLGELSGKKYFVASTLTETSCLDRADIYATECGLTDPNEPIVATYFSDGRETRSLSRPIGENLKKLLSIVPKKLSSGNKNVSPSGEASPESKNSQSSQGTFGIFFPRVSDGFAVDPNLYSVEFTKQSESVNPGYEVKLKGENQEYSLGKFDKVDEAQVVLSKTQKIVASAKKASARKSGASTVLISPLDKFSKAEIPEIFDSRDIKIKWKYKSVVAEWKGKVVQEWKDEDSLVLSEKHQEAQTQLLNACLAQRKIKLNKKSVSDRFLETSAEMNENPGAVSPWQFTEGYFYLKGANRDTKSSFYETHFLDVAFHGGEEISKRSVDFRNELLKACQERKSFQIKKVNGYLEVKRNEP